MLHLSCHRGFPSLGNLQCPIFLQDKFAYIQDMPKYFLPSMKILIFNDATQQQDYFNSLKFRDNLAQ